MAWRKHLTSGRSVRAVDAPKHTANKQRRQLHTCTWSVQTTGVPWNGKKASVRRASVCYVITRLGVPVLSQALQKSRRSSGQDIATQPGSQNFPDACPAPKQLPSAEGAHFAYPVAEATGILHDTELPWRDDAIISNPPRKTVLSGRMLSLTRSATA